MATPFNQGQPTIPVVLNTSNCFVFGNTASGNALSVQQLGTGNVATFRTTTGSTALFVGANGNVGVGTTNPATALDVFTGTMNAATVSATTLTGAGSGITALNMGNAGSGTLAVARGGTGVTSSTGTGSVVLSAGPTLSGTVTGGTFSGTHTGDGSGITSLNMGNAGSGTLAVARGGTGVTSSTGTGSVVLSAAPTMTGTVSVQGGAASGRTDFYGDAIEIGQGRTADGVTLIDFHAAEGTYPDYATRIQRGGGANGSLQFYNRGTGEMQFVNQEAGGMVWYTSGTERMRMGTSGYISIGNVTPSYPLHVNGAVLSSSQNLKYIDYNSVPNWSTVAPGQTALSIYGSGKIGTSDAFVIFSDSRIKTEEQAPQSYLELVSNVNVKNFSYIDKIQYGPQKKMGFFAQEVEKVLPDAVSKICDFIPNIFRKCSAEGNCVTITDHGLTEGTRIRIIKSDNVKNDFDIHVVDENTVQVDTVLENEVFVFGTEVDDFRVLNNDYMSAVAFGGLKELHALVKTQQTTIEMLTERLTALEARAPPS